MPRRALIVGSIGVAALALVALTAVHFRYAIVPAGNRAIKMDRWTGQTWYVGWDGEHAVPAAP